MHKDSIVRPWGLLATSSVVACLLLGQTTQAGDIAGKWEGKWKQCDQCGPACATICKTDCNTYRMTLTGTHYHVLPFLRDVKLCVVGQAGDRLLLEGRSMLGFCSYRATASCHDILIDYCSHHHKGAICLQRCGCGGPPPVAYAPPHYHAAPVAPAPAYRIPIDPPPPTGGF